MTDFKTNNIGDSSSRWLAGMVTSRSHLSKLAQ